MKNKPLKSKKTKRSWFAYKCKHLQVLKRKALKIICLTEDCKIMKTVGLMEFFSNAVGNINSNLKPFPKIKSHWNSYYQ